ILPRFCFSRWKLHTSSRARPVRKTAWRGSIRHRHGGGQSQMRRQQMVQMSVGISRNGEAEFHVTNAKGPCRVKAIAVSRADQGPIWWIVSTEYSETWVAGHVTELVGKAADEGRATIQELASRIG